MDKWNTLSVKGVYTSRTRGLSGVAKGQTKTGYRAYIEISDYNWLIKSLGQVNDEARKEFKKNIRKASKSAADGIRKNIRSKGIGTRNMRGFDPKVIPGRLTWGTGKPATSAIISAPRVNVKKSRLAVARIRVSSPATVLADMAGKTNAATNSKPRTDPYPYSLSPSGYRTHKITIRGSRAFIQNLNAKLGDTASRMVYPGVEQVMPQVINDYGEVIQNALNTIQRKVNEVK